jgi:hypothetical protein
MSNGEPNKPTPEECLKALQGMINAFSCTKLETQAQCTAYEEACKVANKLWRRDLWERIHHAPL